MIEVGHRRRGDKRGALVRSLLKLARTAQRGPLGASRGVRTPGPLRRELRRLLSKFQDDKTTLDDVSVALLGQDGLAAKSLGEGAIFRIGTRGVAELGKPVLKAKGAHQIEPESAFVDDGDRIAVVSPSVASVLEPNDLELERYRFSSPRRLTHYLLNIARKRGQRDASVVTATLGERVAPQKVRPASLLTDASLGFSAHGNPVPAVAAVAC